jgi:hypothetical protein
MLRIDRIIIGMPKTKIGDDIKIPEVSKKARPKIENAI